MLHEPGRGPSEGVVQWDEFGMLRFSCGDSYFPHPGGFSLCLEVQRNWGFHGGTGALLWHIEFQGFRR